MKYLIVRRHGALWKTLRSRRRFYPSVVASRNGKWTRIFALIERQSLQKTHKHQTHKILCSTAAWDSAEVALERAPFQRIVTKRMLWLWLSDNVYKKDVQIQLIKNIKDPQGRTRFAVLRDAAVSAKPNGKWVWKFYLKISNMQNHRIP